jgi:hypothetical protein
MEPLPAPGQPNLSGAGVGSGAVGVGLGATGLGLGLGFACTGLGECDRAAIDPGEAPTLQALESKSSATSAGSRPTVKVSPLPFRGEGQGEGRERRN